MIIKGNSVKTNENSVYILMVKSTVFLNKESYGILSLSNDYTFPSTVVCKLV